jgi:hypothetical protein
MLTLIRVVGDRSFTGATFLVWFGPTVRLTIADPDLIRDIFTSKSEFYEKIEAHPLVKQLEGDGLLSLKGEKWAHHRKIITPTFHMENLKVSFFFFFKKKNRTFGIKGKRKKKCCTYGNDRDFDVILVAVDTRGGEERGGHVGQVVSNVGLRRG